MESVFLTQCHAYLKNGDGPVEAAVITGTELNAVQGLPEPYESQGIQPVALIVP